LPKILNVTDIHIVPEGSSVMGLDPRERLRMVFRSIDRHHADADLCVITGDLTDKGDAASYAVLRDLLGELRVPVRLLLGNHDDRAASCSQFPDAPRAESGFVQSTLDLDGTRLIFLDTLDSADAGRGRLCADRLAWLARRLGESAEGPAIIFMHHPARPVAVPQIDDMRLAEPEAFLALVERHPAVRHIVFGHLHRTITGRWGGVSFSCNRGSCHKIAPELSDGPTHYVVSEPAYDVLLIDRDSVTVHHVDPVGANPVFAREYPTADRRGRIEPADPSVDVRWI
jgi:Icc protein